MGVVTCMSVAVLLMVIQHKVSGQGAGSVQCGLITINPQTTICCNGLIYIRSGFRQACCGSIGYDSSSHECCYNTIQRKQGGSMGRQSTCRPRGTSMQEASTGLGSTCCQTGAGWKCCKKNQNCCSTSGSGSLEVPGFQPACCDIMSIQAKSRCCSATAQKTWALPSCCVSDRVRPRCCTSVTGIGITCCPAFGIHKCCISQETLFFPTPVPHLPPEPETYPTSRPYPPHPDIYPTPRPRPHQPVTYWPHVIPTQPPRIYSTRSSYQPPTRIPPVQPQPETQPTSTDVGTCCSSKQPRPSCCKTSQTPRRCCSSVSGTKKQCCSGYKCCRLVKVSCCSSQSAAQLTSCCNSSPGGAPCCSSVLLLQMQCCIRSGHNAKCCSDGSTGIKPRCCSSSQQNTGGGIPLQTTTTTLSPTQEWEYWPHEGDDQLTQQNLQQIQHQSYRQHQGHQPDALQRQQLQQNYWEQQGYQSLSQSQHQWQQPYYQHQGQQQPPHEEQQYPLQPGIQASNQHMSYNPQPNPQYQSSSYNTHSQVSTYLSCCTAPDMESCCRSGYQLAGLYPDCCSVDSMGMMSDEFRAEGFYPQLDMEERKGSKKSKMKDKSSRVKSKHLNADIKLCSGKAYDSSKTLCCNGVLRNRLGAKAKCCDIFSYDASIYKCCNGEVQLECQKPVGYSTGFRLHIIEEK